MLESYALYNFYIPELREWVTPILRSGLVDEMIRSGNVNAVAEYQDIGGLEFSSGFDLETKMRILNFLIKESQPKELTEENAHVRRVS